MKPIAYEIRRTLTSKFVVIMIIAIVGLVSLLSYENASTYSPVSIPSSPSLTTGYYINGQNLTMVGYFHDAFGSPALQFLFWSITHMKDSDNLCQLHRRRLP